MSVVSMAFGSVMVLLIGVVICFNEFFVSYPN